MLTNQHLLAEHREIKRIPNQIKSGKYNLNWIPDEYTLNTGHVKFFYNKLAFLHKRYIDLYQECLVRWFDVQNYLESFDDLPNELYNDYIPTVEATNINWERIQEKLLDKQTFYKLNR